MKLELKHLTPYLPYELEVQIQEYGESAFNSKINAVCYRTKRVSCKEYNFDLWFKLDEIKPILLPLGVFGDRDDLRKVHKFIGLGKWCEAYDNYFDIWFDDLANIDKLILQAPQEIFNYFLANHFDVFDLIEKGLAIDINTLKTT